MRLTLTIENLKGKDGLNHKVLSTTLRTDIKTGRKVLNEKKEEVEELLTINGMGEIPENDPLAKIAQDITLNLLQLNHKKDKPKRSRKSPYHKKQ